MTNLEFARDFGGILNLLRDHSQLIYSKAGAAEFRQKERSAIAYFVNLIFKKTGINPPVTDPEAIPIASVSDPSYASAKRLVKRVEAVYRGRSRTARTDEEAVRWNSVAAEWERAFRAM